jgi:beta,beta-carotene 9',10'-dioxygenase
MPGSGLLRSLTKNAQKPVEACIRGGGELPNWLKGTLFRNGPGRYVHGDKAYRHLFDGHACIHKFKIDAGKVTYSNQFLETRSFLKSSSESRLYPVFGTEDVCSNLFGRLKTVFHSPDYLDNFNVNIMPYGRKFFFDILLIGNYNDLYLNL